MTKNEEQHIRSLLSDMTKWVNGDAYRSWIRIVLCEIDSQREVIQSQREVINRLRERIAELGEKTS